ncbi:MAG TPA: hypothetical protein VL635_12425 [Trinickia sp.]|jgi:hypothetical protein|nr:hypothetical protein [Trinickia sp.]
MNSFSQRCSSGARASRHARDSTKRCAAGIALVLMLGACAPHGPDYVKPSATTAYRTAAPGGSQPPPAPQP